MALARLTKGFAGRFESALARPQPSPRSPDLIRGLTRGSIRFVLRLARVIDARVNPRIKSPDALDDQVDQVDYNPLEGALR